MGVRARRCTAAGLAALVDGGPAGASAAGGQSGAVVRRTEYGIPHVRADSYRGLGLGAGDAFAEDSLCLLADRNYTAEQGRAAPSLSRSAAPTPR